jgi:hypothetical protein
MGKQETYSRVPRRKTVTLSRHWTSCAEPATVDPYRAAPSFSMGLPSNKLVAYESRIPRGTRNGALFLRVKSPLPIPHPDLPLCWSSALTGLPLCATLFFSGPRPGPGSGPMRGTAPSPTFVITFIKTPSILDGTERIP